MWSRHNGWIGLAYTFPQSLTTLGTDAEKKGVLVLTVKVWVSQVSWTRQEVRGNEGKHGPGIHAMTAGEDMVLEKMRYKEEG